MDLIDFYSSLAFPRHPQQQLKYFLKHTFSLWRKRWGRSLACYYLSLWYLVAVGKSLLINNLRDCFRSSESFRIRIRPKYLFSVEIDRQGPWGLEKVLPKEEHPLKFDE